MNERMKVLLVAPPARHRNTIPKPPLGLAYIAAYLEKKSRLETKILDMYSHGMSVNSLLNEVSDFSPDIIGFSAATPQINIVGSLARTIKEDFGRDLYVIVGGPHASTVPKKTLRENPHIDIAVFGEGEETMAELSETIDTHNFLSVAGIAYRNGGSIKINKHRPLIKNIEDIPFPAWHKLDMNRYLNFNYMFDKKAFPIITARGCMGKCIFCDAKGVWSRRLRMRSAGNIVDEMEALKSVYGVNHIIVLDDTFTTNKSRIELVCNEIRRRNLKITWECNGRVDRINREMLDGMKKAGCIYMAYGIESGSQEILDYTKKNITMEQIKSAVKHTKESGIRAGGFFMMGFPPEKVEHIKKTINFIKELDLDWVSELSILVPYPGTEIYGEMQREGLIIKEEWDTYYKAFSNKVPGESNIKTRYIGSSELLKLKIKYDREISSYMYKKIIKRHLLELNATFSSFIHNPGSFLKSSSRLFLEVFRILKPPKVKTR